MKLAPRIALLLAVAAAAPAQQPQQPPPPWSAHWITAPAAPNDPLPLFRKEFTVAQPVRTATLRISGLGQYEAHLNGANVTRNVLTPGWTDYRKRILFDTYDVTTFVHPGANAIGVLLGNGMYNVAETKGRYTKFANSFGPLKLIAQLDLRFTDGTNQTIASDTAWQTAPGPITFTSIFGGEDFDARRDPPRWDQPNFPAQWPSATETEGPGGTLVSTTIPPIQPFETYSSIATTHPAPNISVYDLAQNFAGWPSLTLTGHAGAKVTLIPGELLDSKGRVTQKSAHQFPDSQNSFTYTLAGRGTESWHPRFSYTGFRFVEARTDPGVNILHLEGHFLHDAVATDGTFTSSSPLFNRTHTLITRAMLSNMVSVLTDCPHREKLGWLEQTHLAGPGLLYNFHLTPLYAKMQEDMADAQLPNGLVPDIAPEFPIFGGPFRDSPEWGAAVVLSPWAAYQFSGDAAPLRTHYPSMQAYAAYLHTRLENNLLLYGLGDWYDIGPKDPGVSQLTTRGLTATAIDYQLLTTLARIATLLNHPEDATRYTAESEVIRKAFNAKFFHPETGLYDRGSQTAQAMPLVLGLVPDSARPAVLDALVRDIRAHQNHVTAGDIGFHYLVRALTDANRSDILFDLLSRADPPSYGAQLAHGATTLTEAWDANPESSQNHFMLGHAEEWFFRGLAGLDLDMSRPPNDRIRIHPAIVGDLQSAAATYQSPQGKIASSWRRTARRLQIDVTIPKGAVATIAFPTEDPTNIRQNNHPLNLATPQTTVPAGTYRFTLPLPPTRSQP